MPSRHRFRSPGVAPRFCARHLAKNPPPAPSRPALASAAALLASALLPAASLDRSPWAVTGPANGKDRAHSRPVLRLVQVRSLPHSSAPPPLARTRALFLAPFTFATRSSFPAKCAFFHCLIFGVQDIGFSDSGDHARCRRSRRLGALRAPPPPLYLIPDWRRLARGSSQVIPDWRGLERSSLIWRRVQRFPPCSSASSVVKGFRVFLANC